MKSTVKQRGHAVRMAAFLNVPWLDVLPLVAAGVTDVDGLDGWSSADIRALRNVGVERHARLVKAIRGAGIFLPDDGRPALTVGGGR